MGDRSIIVITNDHSDSVIAMYGHWSGTDNLTAVVNVLEKTGRLGDDYFASEVFYEFAVALGGFAGVGSLGFGMWADKAGFDEGWTDNPTIYVNQDTGDYTYDGVDYSYEELIKAKEKKAEPEKDVVYGSGE